MERHRRPENEKTGVQKGIDFLLYFNNRLFSISDIADRYYVSRRHAYRIFTEVGYYINIKPAGIRELDHGAENLWTFRLSFCAGGSCDTATCEEIYQIGWPQRANRRMHSERARAITQALRRDNEGGCLDRSPDGRKAACSTEGS